MFTTMKIEELYKLFINSSGVSTDTRNIKSDCLFFALKGENFNGNKFAEEAIKQGANYSVIDEEEFHIEGKTILVKNVLSTLQNLANYHRKQFNIPFIGITGSNGKTTSKELINSVLSTKYKTHFTKGNFNNHIGVPLTLLSIKKDCEIAIIEMGANHIGEIKYLCEIAEPNFGIITNIGTAHIEGFGSREGVKIGKGEMYNFISKNNGVVFTNNDDEVLLNMAKPLNKFTYGKSGADCNASLLSDKPNIKLKWNNYNINSTLYGEYNFYNILLAISVGLYFKVPDKNIVFGIESYLSTNNRSQLIETDKYKIYLDAYNANPSSMKVAIDSFSSSDDKNKLMILGDMLELGSISQEEHQKIIDKSNRLGINTLFVGKEFSKTKIQHNFTFFNNVNELIEYFSHNNLSPCSILIKGSRGIRLENVAEYLQKKE